jgi:hypothetical protein
MHAAPRKIANDAETFIAKIFLIIVELLISRKNDRTVFSGQADKKLQSIFKAAFVL